MKVKIFLLHIIFVAFFNLTGASGDTPKILCLNNEEEIYQIGTIAQIYEDKTNSLSATDVCNPQFSDNFNDIGAKYPNLGVSASTYWIRFRIRSNIRFKALIFNIGYLFHDKLDMYRITNGVPEQIFFSDIKTRSISHNHEKRDRFAVPIELETDSINEYYLAIKDHEGISLFLELSSEENFLRRQSNDSLRSGLIAGVFVLAAIFSMIVYVRDRQMTFLFFFLLNIFFVFTMLCHNGNLQIMFWPGNLKLNNELFILSGFLTNALSFLFTTYFLDLRHRFPRWYALGIILALIMIVGAFSPFLGCEKHIHIFYYTQIVGSIFEIVISYLSLKNGSKLAKPFMVSRLLFSTSILYFALLKLGFLPYPGPMFEAIGSIGICFQVSLLAFVITDYKYKTEINRLSVETISEKQRNEELHNANKVKMEFIGMASHDLKGPLRNISSLAAFIENKQVTDEKEINHMASMIRQSSEKLANLVKDLLDNTALEMGKLELNLEDTDILKCIQSCIDQYELEAKAKNQTIELIINREEKLMVMIDEIRFTQVIENLLSNAIKFSPLGKKIWVIVSKPKDASVLIEIKDEGPGFTEEDKKHLFNYYKKLSAKPTGKESSSGLGLSIVKRILQLHNGTIWLESTAGNGASFFVEI